MGPIDLPFPSSRLARTASALILLAGLGASASAARKKAAKAGDAPPDVTISETFGKKFALEKPPVDFEFPLEEFLPPSEAAGPQSLPGGNDAEANKILLEALGLPESRHLSKPWLPDIPGSQPAEFSLEFPRRNECKRWELGIFDSRGKSVSTLSGTDEPPEKVAWDLKTLAGVPVLAGTPYTYRLQITYRRQKTRSFLGKSFELPALEYRSPGRGSVIEVATKVLFSPKRSELQPEGEELLARALETVAEAHPASFRMSLQDSSPPALLQKRLAAVRQMAARELRAPDGQIQLEASGPRARGSVLEIVIP